MMTTMTKTTKLKRFLTTALATATVLVVVSALLSSPVIGNPSYRCIDSIDLWASDSVTFQTHNGSLITLTGWVWNNTSQTYTHRETNTTLKIVSTDRRVNGSPISLCSQL